MVALAHAASASTSASTGLALRIEQLSHGFALDGQHLPVLERVSLDVAPGECVALLGPSGCGKSTLLRLVAGLEPADVGRVLADGQPIVGPDPSRVVVFQDPTLYPWRRVWDNVALGLEAQGLLKTHAFKVDEALEKVGLGAFARAYPRQLSGGMAQRVALARALVNQPRLLILDEPLGKLDSLTRITMQKELIDLWQRQGYTALLVTHDVEEALLLANRVIVFSDRPATVQAQLSIDRPYRGTAMILIWWTCAGRYWACWGWARAGSHDRVFFSRDNAALPPATQTPAKPVAGLGSTQAKPIRSGLEQLLRHRAVTSNLLLFAQLHTQIITILRPVAQPLWHRRRRLGQAQLAQKICRGQGALG